MKTKRTEGWRGIIYRETQSDGTIIATKQAKNKETKGAIQKEAQILHYLKKYNINFVPQIIDATDTSFTYERIEGVHFDIYRNSINTKKRLKIAEDLLDCGLELDRIGVVHGELKNPRSNVLVTPEDTVKIIDFERGTFTKTGPKNLRHIAQWLAKTGYLNHSTLKKIGKIKQPTQVHLYLIKHLSMYKTKNIIRSILLYVGLILGVDLVSKWLFYNQEYLSFLGFITPVLNTGAGWSVPIPMRLIIILSTILIVGLYFLVNKYNKYERLLLILIAGGAIGNLIDRIVFGGVRDFIDLGFRPVFNIADLAITLGSILFIYYLFIFKKHAT